MFVKNFSPRFVVLSLALFSIVAAGAYVTRRVSATSLGLFAPAEPVNVLEPAPPAAMAPGVCDIGGNIEVEDGTTNLGYATLTAAFAAINAGTHTGTITIDVCGNTDEGTGTAVLNASGTGPASYTSITMSPIGARVISGATTAGSPLIDLNGADNVTIDGLNTGGNSLTIANTTSPGTSGTSTIRFINGATNNTITNSTILGSKGTSVATNGGNIFFSTDAATANGNDNNTISNNNIGPAGSNLPTTAIQCNGSTTTTAIGNSGLNITNNNIFDYFGAAVTSAGIAVNGGCNTFSITNNRFYQTGTRTWTTGAEHNAILMNSASATSGVQGMTITGNIIGFANASGTGVYTLTGSTGIFRGIRFNGITGGAVSNINNNTIASVNLNVSTGGTGTSSPFSAMIINTGNVITNNNTIGSQTATGSLTFTTNTTSATDVYGIYNFSSDNWTSNNNTIGGISVLNGLSATTVVYGLRANTLTSVSWTATGNVIGGSVANSINLNASGTSSQVIGMITNNAASTLTSNTIRNMNTNVGTGTTTSASMIGISSTTTSTNHTLSQNTIHTLTNTNTTAASVVTGIQFTGSTANVVERNLIYNLLAATNNSAAEINGIRVGGGTTQYRNNMIVLGVNQTSSFGAAATNGGVAGINGISEALGTNQFFHNSVFIGGSGTGAGASYAFNGTVTVNTRSNRNNIYWNARSTTAGGGLNYAVKYNGTAPNPTGLTVNNNIYFANGTGGTFGFYNSANVANLSGWQTAVGQDAQSFQSNVPFINPVADPPDLHLSNTIPTVAEGNGVDVGVILDYDGETRALLTPVDIGADAGNFIGIDLAPPVITYTPLGNTVSTLNRIQTVNITDVSGVATGGNAPRIYYNKNAGPYSSTACTLVAGTVFSGTWDCTIDNSLVGGVVAGDVIRYFVVAQDVAGNLGANPSAGFSGIDVNTITTPPTTPNQYNISFPVAGPYNVGTGETYTSLTNPGGIFEFINNNVVTGDVTINITTDLTGETGTHALNEFASPHSVLIKPSGAPRIINGNSATAIIKLNGADNVTINGSTAGLLYEPEAEPEVLGGNPAIRELTIQNANAAGAAIWVATNATSGATNNTIKNLNIVGPGAFGGQGIIAGSGTTFGGPAETGRQNSFNTIRNVSAVGVQNAVFTSGDATTLDQNWLITENEFGSTVAAQKLSFRGVAVLSAQTFTISENRIFGISSSTGSSATMSGILVGGVLNGGGILRNEIRDIRQNNTIGWGSNGIFLNATNATAGVTVANNFISDIASDGFNGFNQDDNGYGIMVNSGGQYGIWNNTIVMNTNQVKTTGHSSCINIEDAVAANSVAIQNNILQNRQTVGNRYGIIDQRATPAVYSALSNNLYHNPTGAFFGRLGTTNHATLASWQTATGLDGGSLSADPLFVSTTDFHLTATSPAIDAGATIPLVPDDIDNDTRPQGPAYDIGADELLLTTYTVGGTVSGLLGTGLVLQNNGGDDLTITANGPFTFATALPDLSPYNVTVLTQPTGPAQVCTVTNGSGTISGANVTNVQVTCVTVQWPLNVSLAGSGTGSVSSSPAGISCPGTCSANFDDSTLVTLTPTAGIGSVFAGWSGDCTGMGPCTVNMTAARNVTATFNLLPQVQFASAVFQDDESQSATITVTRTVDLTGSSSVDVTLTDNTATGGAACTSGIDYINPGTVTLNFAPTVASQSFNVTLCGDTLNESLETVNLALSNPVNAFIVPPSTAILNINDTANQWRNPALITINDGTIAAPYPSTITVSGAPSSIGSIRVTLYDVWHNFPDDINVLLVGPTGATYVLMADAGGPAPGIPSTDHVTLTFSDLPNPVVPDSTAPTTGKYLPTTWEPVGSFPGSAPPAPYPTPGNAPVSGRTVVNTLFGAFGLSDGNGVWSLYIVDDDGVPAPFGPESVGGEVLGGWGLELLAPTNTSVTVSGRVMTPDGVGLRNAVVSMTDSFGVVRQVTTSSLGYYTFAEVPVGDTYVMSVSSRRYRFTPRLVPVVDTLTDVDFIGQE